MIAYICWYLSILSLLMLLITSLVSVAPGYELFVNIEMAIEVCGLILFSILAYVVQRSDSNLAPSIEDAPILCSRICRICHDIRITFCRRLTMMLFNLQFSFCNFQFSN